MPLPENLEYTYNDLLNFNGPERYELIDGELFMMSPPNRFHQSISIELSRQLANFLDGKMCKVFAAPFSVKLFANPKDRNELIKTAVEPDISVICDPSKLDRQGCIGAPDMIIEILSPSSMRHDRLTKLRLYQQAGVKEYWIANPEEKSVQVLLLDCYGQYRIYEFYTREQIAKVNVLEGCYIDLAKVFSE